MTAKSAGPPRGPRPPTTCCQHGSERLQVPRHNMLTQLSEWMSRRFRASGRGVGAPVAAETVTRPRCSAAGKNSRRLRSRRKEGRHRHRPHPEQVGGLGRVGETPRHCCARFAPCMAGQRDGNDGRRYFGSPSFSGIVTPSTSTGITRMARPRSRAEQISRTAMSFRSSSRRLPRHSQASCRPMTTNKTLHESSSRPIRSSHSSPEALSGSPTARPLPAIGFS